MKTLKALIADIFPRHWCLIAEGGIELRRIIPATRFCPGVWVWSVFSRVRINDATLPMHSFGQKPMASGWSFVGNEGVARFDATEKLRELWRVRNP